MPGVRAARMTVAGGLDLAAVLSDDFRRKRTKTDNAVQPAVKKKRRRTRKSTRSAGQQAVVGAAADLPVGQPIAVVPLYDRSADRPGIADAKITKCVLIILFVCADI